MSFTIKQRYQLYDTDLNTPVAGFSAMTVNQNKLAVKLSSHRALGAINTGNVPANTFVALCDAVLPPVAANNVFAINKQLIIVGNSTGAPINSLTFQLQTPGGFSLKGRIEVKSEQTPGSTYKYSSLRIHSLNSASGTVYTINGLSADPSNFVWINIALAGTCVAAGLLTLLMRGDLAGFSADQDFGQNSETLARTF